MSSIRFICSGQVGKPLPQALVTALPAIKANALDLQTYARKLNAGKDNEEANRVIWGDEPNRIWWDIDLAVPIPIPGALQTKLSAIRSGIRQLKTYASITGKAVFRGTYHVCHHEDSPPTCEPEQEI